MIREFHTENLRAAVSQHKTGGHEWRLYLDDSTTPSACDVEDSPEAAISSLVVAIVWRARELADLGKQVAQAEFEMGQKQ